MQYKIHFLEGKFPSSNSYLLIGEKNILIDPGAGPLRIKLLQNWLKEIDVNRLDEIWITHAHPDHAQLASYFDLPVRVHPVGGIILSSYNPIKRLALLQTESIEKIFRNVISLPKLKMLKFATLLLSQFYIHTILSKWQKVKKLYFFEDNSNIYGIKIIYLPGHTDDEVGFIINDRIMITGDLISSRERYELPSLNTPCADIDKTIRTLELIRKLNPEIVYTGHGSPIYELGYFIEKAISKTNELLFLAKKLYREYGLEVRFFRKLYKSLPDEFHTQIKLSLLGILLRKCLRR